MADTPGEEIGQIGHILQALAKRRQHDRHDIQPVVEIFAKIAGIDRRFEIAMRGSNDANIHLECARATDALQLAFLQDTQQLGLKCRGDFTDLVEKQGAAIRRFETPLA